MWVNIKYYLIFKITIISVPCGVIMYVKVQCMITAQRMGEDKWCFTVV